jgi:hypothetical protein
MYKVKVILDDIEDLFDLSRHCADITKKVEKYGHLATCEDLCVHRILCEYINTVSEVDYKQPCEYTDEEIQEIFNDLKDNGIIFEEI